MRKKCVMCDKEFEPKESSQIYCSVDCRQETAKIRSWWYHHNGKSEITKEVVEKYRKSRITICKVCGKKFIRTGGQQKTCSDRCKIINFNNNAQKRYKKQRSQKGKTLIKTLNKEYKKDPKGKYYGWVIGSDVEAIHKISESNLSEFEFKYFLVNKDIVKLSKML